ncbi:MAG: hypothetical protein ACI4MA_04850 [Treponema sp.]
MKRVIGAVVSLFLMAGAAFARGAYDGDIQLHLGVGFDSAKLEKSVEPYSGYVAKSTIEGASATFDFDIATWHLFNFNDVFGLGFVVGFNGGVGGTTNGRLSATANGTELMSYKVPFENLGFAAHFNGIIGPAVGIKLGKVVKFDIGLGLAYGFSVFSYNVPTTEGNATTTSSNLYLLGGVGFGAEVQAKFVPNSPVSPVIGYRFAYIPGNKCTTFYNGESTVSSYDVADYVNNEIYVGITFNW